MLTVDADDLEATGYFLPEDSWLRLKKLREYVEFLANLARPRRADEDKEWAAEIRPGEVAVCLELLEEQIGLVLGELSWPAERGETVAACAAGTKVAASTEVAAPDVAEPVIDQAGGGYVFGATLGQLDEINLVLDSLRVHGDVITNADHVEYADCTPSVLGGAILRDAQKLRDIIRGISAQSLGTSHHANAGVREERTTRYLVSPARSPAAGGLYVVR